MSRVRQSGFYPSNETGQLVAVPATMRFNALPAPIAGRVTDRYVQSTSSTTVGPSQLIRFELPPMEYLMPGSVFMRAKFVAKATAAADAKVILNSAADFIRRLDVRCGGTTLDSINRYDKLYQILRHTNCPTQYVDTDGNALELMNFQIPAPGGAGVFGNEHEFCIPIVSGVTSTDRAIPLELLRSPLVFSIELNSATAISGSGFSFEIRDPRLYYQTCDMGEVYNNSLRMELAQSGLMRLPYTTFSESEYSIGAAGTFSPLIGENCSSLLGVLVARQRDIDVPTKGGDTQGIFAVNGFQDVQFKVDGLNKPSYLIDSTTLAYAEVQKLYSMLWDTDHSGSATKLQAIDANPAGAQTDHSNGGTKFVYGFSATRFHENGLSSVGTPVSNNIQIFQTGNTLACQAYVYTIKEYSLMISPETIQVAK